VKQAGANRIPRQSLSDFLNEFSIRVAENFKKGAKPLLKKFHSLRNPVLIKFVRKTEKL